MTHSFNRLTTVAALDIGSSKVCCIIAKISRDKRINVVGYGYNASKGIKNGIITDINQATLSVCNAVETAEQMANERIDRVIVNVSGDKIKSVIKSASISINKNRPISEVDINKVIEKGIHKINVEGNELIHCLPMSYRCDGGEEIKDPRNIFGENLSVDILLGLIPDIMFRNINTVIENAHLEIAEKAFSAYASGLSCLVEDEMELGATVVDIGGGTTDVATISLGGIVSSRSIRMAGDKMNDAIAQYVRQNMNLLIGERTAEKLKWDVGSASVEAAKEMGTTEVRGRDLVTGLPKTMEVSAVDVSTALQDVVENIINAIKGTLEETSPEIAADVIDHGIVLTGGGALLKHLPDVIADATKVPVFIANDPLDCVAIGTGESLKSIDVMKK